MQARRSIYSHRVRQYANQLPFDLSLMMNPTANIAMPPATAPVNDSVMKTSALVGTFRLPLAVTTVTE
jgi:hypothetical protein